MPVTIRDVAAAVGVSASTVSRAFSRPEKVDEATRRRVLAAAEQLQYRPNRAAQMLNTGRTMCLGAVLPDIENPFFASMLKGIEQSAGELGYQTLVADTDEDVDGERRAVHALLDRVDGLLLCSTRLEDEEILRVAQLTRVVLVNRVVGDLPHISFDNADGIRQAVLHLRALGHRHIGYVSGQLASRSARERREAFVEALPDDLPDGTRGLVVGDYPPTFDGGSRATDEVLASGVSAVVVYNDLMAIGLLNRMLGYGLPVPQRLSVVSFDNVPIAAMVTPALTSVETPRMEAGRMAAEVLHRLIEDGSDETHVVLPTRLVGRQSTAPVEVTSRG